MHKTKKTIALLLVYVMTLSLFSFMPVLARAMDAQNIASYITAQTGLSASVGTDGVTVTVTGAPVTRNTTLLLEIDQGVIVNWGAAISGSLKSEYLLRLTGEGTFNLNLGGTVNNTGAGGQIDVAGTGMTVNIIGMLSTLTNGVSLNISGNNTQVNVLGTISNSGSNSAINVTNNITGTVININGGSVISMPSGYAINDGSGQSGVTFDNDTKINVIDGLVEAGSACAIRSSGKDSVVTVSGGIVRNAAASNPNSTIYMNGGRGDNIIIDGGEIYTINSESATSYVVQTSGNVIMTGGTVRAIKGRAINLVGETSIAYISGGLVETDTGTAICTATTNPESVRESKIIISGGIVQATGTASGTAVRITGANSAVEITDGWVVAKGGLAVDASGAPAAGSINVSGGFVFAWGNGVNKVANKLNAASAGIVVAWNTQDGVGKYDYNQNSSLDLAAVPSTSGTVLWDNDPPSANNGGIRYSNGARGMDFFPLNVSVVQNMFNLTVVNGTSNGEKTQTVEAGSQVYVLVDSELDQPTNPNLGPPYMHPINGSIFNGWTRDDGGAFANASATLTSLIMPANDLTITADFKPCYLFEIYGGFIGPLGAPISPHPTYGWYAEGMQITIARFSSYPPGQSFAGWNYGHTQFVANTMDDETTFQMPNHTAYIGAAPPSNPANASKLNLTVINGTISTTTGGTAINGNSYDCYGGTGLIVQADEPPAGQEFDRWSVSPATTNGGAVFIETDPTTTFVLSNTNVTLTATYKPIKYTLTVHNGPGVEIAVLSANDTYPLIAAAPAMPGMSFSAWAIDSGGGSIVDIASSATTFTMPDSDAAVSAHFEWIDYSLSVIGGIDGLGRSIDAISMITGIYHYGDDVTIIADDPLPRHKFLWWESDDASVIFDDFRSETTSFTMPAAQITVTAKFAPEDDYVLTVIGGFESIGGSAGHHAQNELVRISAANPAVGMRFTEWTEDGGYVVFLDKTSLMTSFVMPPWDITIRANYDWIDYELIVVGGVDGANNSIGIYRYGDQVIVTADDAQPGMRFAWWESDDASVVFDDNTSKTAVFNMPAGKLTVRAYYAPEDDYVLTVIDGSDDYFGNMGHYPSGHAVAITANDPAVGMKFAEWTADGGNIAFADRTSAKTMFMMPPRDLIISANYEWIDYELNVVGGVDHNNLDKGFYHYGDRVMVTADSAQPGMRFAWWETDDSSVVFDDATNITATFTMPAGNLTVRAYYAPENDYVLTVVGGTDDNYGNMGHYPSGNTVAITADDPGIGRLFIGWTADGGNIAFADETSEKTNFAMPAQDLTVRANSIWIDYELTVVGGVDRYNRHVGTYRYGDNVELTADKPDLGKRFVGWTADINGVAFDDYRSETAMFEMPPNRLTVTANYANISNTPGGGGGGGPSNPGSPNTPNTPSTSGSPGTQANTEPSADRAFRSPFIEDHLAYISGYPDGTVRPGHEITRAEVAVVFHRLLINELHEAGITREGSFPDVEPGQWYSTAISVMSGLGIINGYPDGTFKPDGAISRAELATIAAHFAGMMEMPPMNHISFSDIEAHWAAADIQYAAEIGWINGYEDGTFRPARHITRAEFVTLVNRVLERIPESVDDLLPDEMIIWSDNADSTAWYYLAMQEATNSHIAAYKEKPVPGMQFNYEYWVEMMVSG